MLAEAMISFLVVGAVAGFLAGVVVPGFGFGLLGNIAVGVIGAVVAGSVIPRIGLFPGDDIVGLIASAIVGAFILLALVGFARATA